MTLWISIEVSVSQLSLYCVSGHTIWIPLMRTEHIKDALIRKALLLGILKNMKKHQNWVFIGFLSFMSTALVTNLGPQK